MRRRQLPKELTTTRPLALELQSSAYDFLEGTADLGRLSGLAGALSWSAGGISVSNGGTEAIDYDGTEGRLVVFLRNLQVRLRENRREIHIPCLVAIHTLTQDEISAQRAVLDFPEHLVVAVRVVDTEQAPLNNFRITISSTVPESTSIAGQTNEAGEFRFLAQSGWYSVVTGPERHAGIEVRDSDRGERLVVLRMGASGR